MEDGREAFGKEYGLGYYDVYDEGYMTPIVNVNLDYKKQVRYGDEVEIKTIFEDVVAAKICFSYEMRRASDGEIVAKGVSTQVFLDTEGQLQLTNPAFYDKWKVKHGLR